MNQAQRSAFKDPTGLSKWIKWLICARIVICVITLLYGTLGLRFWLAVHKGDDFSTLSVRLPFRYFSELTFALPAHLAIFVILVILISKWIYRTNFNAHQLGASEMKFTPGWSIGWYFIPVALWWKPYQAMKEIWKASKNPQDWKTQGVSSLLPWWWFFWIVSNFLGSAWAHLYWLYVLPRAYYAQWMGATDIVIVLYSLTGIMLSIIVLVMVGKVNEMQMGHYRKGS